MKKIIFAVPVVLIIGVGYVIWHSNYVCDPSHCDPPPTSQGLQLSASSGDAPFKVKVLGPAQLVGKEYAKPWNRILRCGFDIDWGDGTQNDGTGPEHDCANYTTHTYKRPGTYMIRGTVWHLTGDDTQITEWTGTAKVKVGGQ